MVTNVGESEKKHVHIASKKKERRNWTKRTLISLMFLYLILFLLVPLIFIFIRAFEQGAAVYFAAATDRDALSAIKLTLLVTVITVPLNTIFGIAAAWCITKFQFKGKQVLLSIIELPFAISPVIAGLVFILLFSPSGVLGTFITDWGIRLLFSVPGIVIATLFITLPFVARELIPVMQAQGTAEEEAAVSLGADGWQMFRQVTLPAIKWGLLYGMILCSARSIGEFGAVSVVSGRIRGMTNTMPLHVEILYNEYQFTAAFAVASLMSLLALVTLFIKSWVEWRTERE